MNNADRQYLELVEKVLTTGTTVDDRTGVGSISIFGHQMRFDLNEGFPALTTKKLAWKAIVGELLWFLEGSSDERRLAEITFGRDRSELVGKSTIWTANADAQGRALGYTNTNEVKELGPVYGVQWRNWRADRFGANPARVSHDQVSELIRKLRTNPGDRRLILSAWNVGQIHEMSLPPCHCFAQFRVYGDKLSCLMYQRSCDIGLGVPFNIASYALLTHLIAREVGLQVGEFVHTLGDAHIYLNHVEPMKKMLSLEPYALPTLRITPEFDLAPVVQGHDWGSDATAMITLENYVTHPPIKMDMAV